MADRDRRAFISRMRTAAPRHFPLLWADHARCQSRWNRSIARTAPPAIALHAAGCPRASRACARTRTEPEKIRANPLISLNSVPEMQQIAAKTPRRPPKFPANREIFAI